MRGRHAKFSRKDISAKTNLRDITAGARAWPNASNVPKVCKADSDCQDKLFGNTLVFCKKSQSVNGDWLRIYDSRKHEGFGAWFGDPMGRSLLPRLPQLKYAGFKNIT